MNHVDEILNLCSEYAKKWKLKFNTNKCNWYFHGKSIIKNPIFILNRDELKKVDSLIHMGLPKTCGRIFL